MFTGGIQLLQLDIFMKHYKELMTTRSTIQQQPLKNVQNSMCLTLALSLSLSLSLIISYTLIFPDAGGW
jgi:hypothetical protein